MPYGNSYFLAREIVSYFLCLTLITWFPRSMAWKWNIDCWWILISQGNAALFIWRALIIALALRCYDLAITYYNAASRITLTYLFYSSHLSITFTTNTQACVNKGNKTQIILTLISKYPSCEGDKKLATFSFFWNSHLPCTANIMLKLMPMIVSRIVWKCRLEGIPIGITNNH